MSKPHAPDRIKQRADRIKDDWQAGLIHARRTYRDQYLTLRVTPQWRLLSKDNERAGNYLVTQIMTIRFKPDSSVGHWHS